MNSGLTRGLEKNTVSFSYGLTPFRGRSFSKTHHSLCISEWLVHLTSSYAHPVGCVLDKKRAQSAQILYYSVSRCMKKDVDKEKTICLRLAKGDCSDLDRTFSITSQKRTYKHGQLMWSSTFQLLDIRRDCLDSP